MHLPDIVTTHPKRSIEFSAEALTYSNPHCFIYCLRTTQWHTWNIGGMAICHVSGIDRGLGGDIEWQRHGERWRGCGSEFYMSILADRCSFIPPCHSQTHPKTLATIPNPYVYSFLFPLPLAKSRFRAPSWTRLSKQTKTPMSTARYSHELHISLSFILTRLSDPLLWRHRSLPSRAHARQ